MTFNTTGLLEPQKEHAKKLATSLFWNGVAADMSDTGVGKTFSAAAIARHFDCPIVIVGPKLILSKWKEILKSFGKEPAVMINFEKLCRGNTPWLKYPSKKQLASKASVDLNGIATGRKFKPDEKAQRHFNAIIKFPAGALVIIDEGHRCKSVNSLQAGFLIALKRQGYKILILSATLATTPLDLRAAGYAMNLIPNPEMRTYKEFCISSGAVPTGHYGALTFDDTDNAAQRKMTEIHTHLFDVSKIGARLTRAQMGNLFPDNERICEAWDMGANSEKIQQSFDIMERELAKLDESIANYSGHIFAIIMAHRRRCEMLKIPSILDRVEDLYDEKKSVAVFLNFTESIEVLKCRLERMRKFRDKNLIGLIYGNRTVPQRDDDINLFQTDQKRVMLVNIACAESIGLHDLTGKYPRASIINPSFSAIKVCQADGRCCRQGGQSKTLTYFVFADKTYESTICDRLSSKLDNIEFLNNGDLTAGISWFRYAEGKCI